ncbi:MAG: signal peptidase I [Planctomyces sp.]
MKETDRITEDRVDVRHGGDRQTDDRDEADWLRQSVELMICFVIAVLILRTFIVEGYLISTGSMAPGLLGFHKRVVCPSCEHPFAFGVSFDDSVSPEEQERSRETFRKYATCPNCGQINIDVSEVPISHGDQLLVLKHIYDFRSPRRWETIVFRNPATPGEAYVKRIVGLPGDELLIRDGDLYNSGRLLRKGYDAQKGTRILVSDLQYLADSPLWEMSWQLNDTWQQKGAVLETPRSEELSWLSFRHWRWFGGSHFVETPLSAATADSDWREFQKRYESVPISWASRLEYDTEKEVLRCEGVMPADMQQDLISQATSEEFRRAVYRLAAMSHLAPVTDRYGYNSMVSSPEYPVNDLMLRCVLSWKTAPKEIRVTVPIDSEVYDVIVNPEENQWQLKASNEQLQSGAFVPDSVSSRADNGESGPGLELEVSAIDHQILIAVNGQPVGVPLELAGSLPAASENATVPSVLAGTTERAQVAEKLALAREQQNRWAIGIRGDGVRVEELQMYRDVYYTPGRRRNAVESPYRVPEGNYFVQGDNSPVSSDSRNWAQPCVPHKMLLGKPFIVHLPSKPAVLELAGYRWPIRIPDWQRIRYIP